MKKDIILAGVGGQGILSIATVIGEAALQEGMYLKQAEVHGMSQRGGDVQSNLRLSSEPIMLIKLKSIQLAAVYDIDPEKSKAFAEKYPTVKIMNSLQELINSPEAELIIITSPTY